MASEQIVNVKGTHDIIDREANGFAYIENVIKQIAELFAFKEIRPPVLEYSPLFIRGVGDASDIVRKEMYTFLDKGNRSVTLRPEFTAGIMRVIVQNKLYVNNELPLKYYYLGPVFRYERPQLGRYRQFNQFGVESVGNDSPYSDIDVIILAYTILQSLNLENVVIKINTLGDEESRLNYKNALKEYFAKYIDNMCEDCKSRFMLNPLRILDCKVPADQEIVKGAPKISDYLTENAKNRFNLILNTLEEMEIPYAVDDTLVRGLDYYSDVVFEFHYTSKKGNNYGAVGAGGHYAHLVKEVGGPDLPGVGFSFGIERLYNVLNDDDLLPPDIETPLPFYIMPLGDIAKNKALAIATNLRMAGYPTDMCFDNVKMANMFKRAEKKKALYAIILGENEVNNGEIIIKDLTSKEQISVKDEEFMANIDNLFAHEGCECEEHEHGCCCGAHEHADECCCGGQKENEGEEHKCCCHHHKGE